MSLIEAPSLGMFRSMFLRAIFLSSLAALSSGDVFGKTRAELTQEWMAANPKAAWWDAMDTGPFISDTFLGFGPKGEVAVLKGIAIKLGDKEDCSVVFDTETLRMVAGFDGVVKMAGTPWSGRHADNSYLPENRKDYFFATNKGPGIAVNGTWEDPRKTKNGPLPDEQAAYLGIYRHESGTVLSYTAGGSNILEMPWSLGGGLVRSFRFEKMKNKVEILVLDPLEDGRKIAVQLRGARRGVSLETLDSGRFVVSFAK